MKLLKRCNIRFYFSVAFAVLFLIGSVRSLADCPGCSGLTRDELELLSLEQLKELQEICLACQEARLRNKGGRKILARSNSASMEIFYNQYRNDLNQIAQSLSLINSVIIEKS